MDHTPTSLGVVDCSCTDRDRGMRRHTGEVAIVPEWGAAYWVSEAKKNRGKIANENGDEDREMQKHARQLACSEVYLTAASLVLMGWCQT